MYGRVEWSNDANAWLSCYIFQGVKWLVKLVVICHFKSKFGLLSKFNGNSHIVFVSICTVVPPDRVVFKHPVGWDVIMRKCPLKNDLVFTCKQGEELTILPKWFHKFIAATHNVFLLKSLSNENMFQH